jgi:hypothetical protein
MAEIPIAPGERENFIRNVSDRLRASNDALKYEILNNLIEYGINIEYITDEDLIEIEQFFHTIFSTRNSDLNNSKNMLSNNNAKQLINIYDKLKKKADNKRRAAENAAIKRASEVVRLAAAAAKLPRRKGGARRTRKHRGRKMRKTRHTRR